MPEQPVNLTNRSILIVDDTPANLRLLAQMLADQGFRVRAATSGARALASIRAEPPDLILLDIRMPQMDGYEVCRRLKRDEQTRQIPIIFISALGETEDKVKAFTMGGVDYITKPLHIEEVLARVQTHLTLRVNQERYEMATLAGRVGVWDWDIQGDQFYLGPGVKALLGYSEDEMPSDLESWAGHAHPDDRAAFLETIRAHLAGQAGEYVRELRMVHRDGRVRWFLIQGQTMRNTQGRPIRLLGTATDVTERRQAEEAQKELIEQLRRALSQVKTLSGLLPICASCKKIRDDQGYWQQVEEYVRAHADVEFSHGICPDCAEKLYGDLYRE